MTFGEVLELQKFLAADGSFNVELTGTFGPLTRAALAQYQSKSGIQATGYFGPSTRAHVNAAGCANGQVLGAYDQLSVTTTVEKKPIPGRPTATSTKPVKQLTLVTPTAGTAWQIGNSHTISWTPNGDNPDMDAFFEIKKGKVFEKVAQLVQCAKGSIVWCGDIDKALDGVVYDGSDDWTKAKPGNYYLSITDRTTGQNTRTRNPVKLVEYGKIIKLKLTAHLDKNKKIDAGAEDYTALTLKDRNITLSWQANADTCWVNISPLDDDAGQDGYAEIQNLKRHVTKQTIALPGNYSGYSVNVTCGKGSNQQTKRFAVSIEGAVANVPYITLVESKAAEDNELYAEEKARVFGTNLSGDTKVYIDYSGGRKYFETTYTQSGSVNITTFKNGELPDGNYVLYAINGNKTSNGITVTYKNPKTQKLQVMTPNGGESFTRALEVLYGWRQDYETSSLVLTLWNAETGTEYYRTPISGSVGKNAGTLRGEAVNVPQGNYKITICDDKQVNPSAPFKPLCDSSDGSFTIGGTSEVSCQFTRDLTLGSTGQDVRNLQNFLEEKGFLPAQTSTWDGYFGPSTQAALAKYQASKGISPADGYFGPIVRAYIAIHDECRVDSGPETAGLVVDNISVDSDSEDGIGTFVFEVDLSAVGDDIYIATSSRQRSDDLGFDWTIVGGSGTSTVTVQSDADIVGSNFVIDEGSTETFTIVITIDPASSGSYYVILNDVSFREGSAINQAQTFKFEPASDFDTPAVSVTAAMGPLSAPSARVAANTGSYSAIASLPNLSVGSTDPGVALIQGFLNANGFVVNASAGQPGSVGYEGNYFGTATQRALAAWQASKGISPANGSFGPQTRALMSQ
jgi:peptidoglycan hydrolase-like protein with peptidoglycan-binding domain